MGPQKDGTPGTDVRLDLLEGFRLLYAGRTVVLVGNAQRLLAYLALTGPAARAVAAGTLWPEVAEARALASLRTSIWQCNRAVAGLVAARGHRIALAGFARIDIRELDGAALPGGRPAGILRTRRGELLPGWYDDWVIAERERLSHRRLQLLEDAARRLTATGNVVDAYELAFEAVRSDPLRESARRVLIGVHLAQHNVNEAVREYRRFRRLLFDHLGVEPSADLAHLVFGDVSGGVAGRRRSRLPATPPPPVSSVTPRPPPRRSPRRQPALPR